MIDLQTVVWVILYIIGACAVFAILYWLPIYIAQNFPWFAPAVPFIHVALAVLGALVVIGVILSLITGTPIVRISGGGRGPQ